MKVILEGREIEAGWLNALIDVRGKTIRASCPLLNLSALGATIPDALQRLGEKIAKISERKL